MFYPDLEENSSRGIKSGAISKYQRNVGLYPAAFALLVNFFNQVINLFCFMQTYHCSGNPFLRFVEFYLEENRLAKKIATESGIKLLKKIYKKNSRMNPGVLCYALM